jgi:glycosyltransferase involved in cell wall biosynthesis
MTEQKPFITICLPAWNAAVFLRQAIACVYAQTSDDWELLMVDDGSKDDTWAIMQEHADNPKVRILQNERNLGQAGVFNRMMGEIRGKWMILLAADDFIVPHTVATLKAELENQPETVLWIHNHLNRGFGRKPHLVTVYDYVQTFETMEFAELVYLKGNIFGEITNFVVRHDAIAKIHPPFKDGTQTVDIRCWMRVAAANPGKQVIYWPEALAHILEHDSSVSSNNTRSGETFVDFFRLPTDLLDVKWRKKVLLLQVLRMIYCWFKFGRRLPAGKKGLPIRTAGKLLQHVFAGNPN